MKKCPACNSKYENRTKKCPACNVSLIDEYSTARRCKRCGRVLDEDEIVCRSCEAQKESSRVKLNTDSAEMCQFCGEKLHMPWEQSHRMCVACHNKFEPAEREENKETRSNKTRAGIWSGLIVIGCILLFISSISIRPVWIFGTDSETVVVPISWNSTVQPSSLKSKPKEVIKGENLVFEFGTSSSNIDSQLDNYNYSYMVYDDQIIMASKNNQILFGLTGLDIGRCVTLTNWGVLGGYDDLTYYGYTLYSIEYSCLKKHNSTEIFSTDELVLMLFRLNVIDKMATYSDLKSIFDEKYGQSTSEEVDAERGTGCAVWMLDNDTIVILDNNSYDVKVQYQTSDAYQREQELREIREKQALERENAIRAVRGS